METVLEEVSGLPELPGVDAPSSAITYLVEALRPFAEFYEAMRHMGGTTPKTGIYQAIDSAITGPRELTVEDYKRAFHLRARLSGQMRSDDAAQVEGESSREAK